MKLGHVWGCTRSRACLAQLQIWIKVGVMNPIALPLIFVLTTPEMLMYEVTFELQEMVQL